MLAGIEVPDGDLQMEPTELWACLQEVLSVPPSTLFFIPRSEAFGEGAGVRVQPPVTLATSKKVRLCDQKDTNSTSHNIRSLSGLILK